MKRCHPLPILLALGLLAGCATMSKKECETADWQSLGYSDGSRGIHYSNIEKRRKSCSKYDIAPDDAAYRAGWDEGIRRYCTPDTGYQVGSAGQPYNNICPPDVEAAFLSGWQQGVRQYCVPGNALQLGLNGHPYRGVCPPDVAGPFQDFYRLGADVRQARAAHHYLEVQEQRTGQALAGERDPKRYRELLHELARLRHDENRSDAQLIALEACMSDDWFDAGYRDGEAGGPERSFEIAGVCRNYGIMADRPGYRDGWLQGNGVYCTYDSGLYVGQSNQEYMGVCSGLGHRQFWRGYEEGRHMFEQGRYEAHPRPVGQRPARQAQPPVMHQPEQRQPGFRPAPVRQQPARQQPQRPATGKPAIEKKPQPERPAMPNRVQHPETAPATKRPPQMQPQQPQAKPQRPAMGRQPQQPEKPAEQSRPQRAGATPAQPAGNNGKAARSKENKRSETGKPKQSEQQRKHDGEQTDQPDNAPARLNAPAARP